MDIITAVKEKTGLNQNQIASAIDESPEMVSAWKRGTMPSGLVTLKLMELANISREEAIKLMKKEKGFTSISMLLVVAVFSVVYFLGITRPVYLPNIIAIVESVGMYIMLNRILTRIRRLFKFHYLNNLILRYLVWDYNFKVLI